MKQVLLIRHAHWNQSEDVLDAVGRESCVQLRTKLPAFDLIVSAPRGRCQETAVLLTNKQTAVDARVGTVKIPEQHRPQYRQVRGEHPLGAVGALWSVSELHEPLRLKGIEAKGLVTDLLQRLPTDGRAIIVTHDGLLVALEKVLKQLPFDQVDHSFAELEGYWIDEHSGITRFPAGQLEYAANMDKLRQ